MKSMESQRYLSLQIHMYFIQKLKCGVRTHISYLHSIKNSKNVKRNNIRLIETQAKRRCFISLKTERWEENEVIFCLCCISISTLFVYDFTSGLKIYDRSAKVHRQYVTSTTTSQLKTYFTDFPYPRPHHSHVSFSTVGI